MPQDYDIGVMFRCYNAPEMLVPFVHRADEFGFDEMWIVEDCFYAGGLASVAVALAVSDYIRIGLGILPAVARNAAFAAMDIALLARLYPGRFLPGFGHGVADWMRQVGAFPPSQLAALEEVTLTVRELLAGQRVTRQGRYVDISGVQLEFPPEDVPPVSLGVRSPKSLQLAGRSADGTLLAEHSSPAYVRWARAQIAVGQAQAGRADAPHRVTVYMFCAINADRDAALQVMRPRIAAGLASGELGVYLAPLGIADEVAELVAAGGYDNLLAAMPDDWVSSLSVVGTPEDCRASIEALVQAGADSVVLVPVEDDRAMLETLGETLLPILR